MSKLDIKYDVVELVGGGSRIPRVIEIIHEVFGLVTSRAINSN
jgi:molecular chaperone DnaK (HSP70)